MSIALHGHAIGSENHIKFLHPCLHPHVFMFFVKASIHAGFKALFESHRRHDGLRAGPPVRPGRRCRPSRDRGRRRGRCGVQIHQLHQQGRAGTAALVVIAASVVALIVIAAGPVLCSMLHLICSPGDGFCQIHQRWRAGVVALVLIGAGVVFDPVASSTSSTSEAGPVLSPLP